MTANAPKPNTVPIKKFVAPAPANPKSSEKPTYNTDGKPIIETPAKKPFVRRPHLTDRPFLANPALRDLQSELRKREQRQNRNKRVNIKSK